jgi:hypothetical protein
MAQNRRTEFVHKTDLTLEVCVDGQILQLVSLPHPDFSKPDGEGKGRPSVVLPPYGSQQVEHYEIAGYGTARTYLGEEEETDQTLTKLAKSLINVAAAR